MTEPGSIDAHAHWAPQAYVSLVESLGHKAAGGPLSPLMFDLEKRLKWMDERGVQMHVLTLSGSMPWQWASQDAANRLARIVNDAAIEAHKAYPDRFVAGVAMPMRDPAAALRELDRVAGSPACARCICPTRSKDTIMSSSPRICRSSRAARSSATRSCFIRSTAWRTITAEPERLAGATFMYNTLGFPFDTATTAAKFIFTGLLDKFPKLEIVLPHSGGCFPYIAGRIEHSIKKGVADVKLERPFREYIRRFHYDTLAYYPETLRFMIELVGSDRVVIGTDNYAKMDVEQPNALVEELKLPAADRERILRGNAAKLLRIATD